MAVTFTYPGFRLRTQRHLSTRSEYDPADNLIGKLDQQPAAQHRQLLHYDSTGRIIASQDSLHGQRETFAYDAAANLLDGPQAGAGLVVHNKLLTYQDKRYRYDAFGRMIEKRSAKRGVQRFAYDAESRLVEVRNESGSVVRMVYDPLGRRVEKTEHGSDGYPLGETRFMWDGLRLLQEHKHSQTSLYVYEDEGYQPLARVDGAGPLQKIRYYHNDLNGLPEQLTEADGHSVWQATYRVWGNTLEEVREPYYIEEQNLRFQGQYLDRETGLHFNTFRFYDPDVGRFTTPDPIGLNGGLNFYAYALNPFGWNDPLGLSCRLNSVGRTPGKGSRTGKAVIARMRAEGKIIGSGKNMRFQSTDKKWYSIKDADMAHKTDAVKYWNSKGGYHGAKTKEVRGWMRDPDNYELEYYSHNRSKGALLTDRYKDPGDFIGPAEKPRYY